MNTYSLLLRSIDNTTLAGDPWMGNLDVDDPSQIRWHHINRYCGESYFSDNSTINSTLHYSSDDVMKIKFTTDASVQKQGFIVMLKTSNFSTLKFN